MTIIEEASRYSSLTSLLEEKQARYTYSKRSDLVLKSCPNMQSCSPPKKKKLFGGNYNHSAYTVTDMIAHMQETDASIISPNMGQRQYQRVSEE